MKYALMAGLLLTAVQTHAAEAMRTISVTLVGPQGQRHVVRAEVADTDSLRQMGLMNRTKMGANDGMVFLWDEPGLVGFWMKNTPLPLDMIFARAGQVLAVAPNARPMDETVISPPEAVDLVLEVNAGWAAKHNLGPGWKIGLSN